jgi:spermidine synthase
LSALFFVSGAVGLAYEVAWSRALLRLVGSTPAGSAIVLGVFVGALGLGARWAGARAEREARPLARYGQLELLAAAWALAFLPLLSALDAPYVALASGLSEALRWPLRLVFAALLVVPGAFLLGATLPYMVRAWPTRAAGTSRAVPWLYGINTLGAVLGAWGTGFLLIEALGVEGALWAAAATGALVGVVGLLAGRRSAQASVPPAPPDVVPLVRAGLWAAFASGFVGMGLQALGFRVLVFFVEGFTTSLAAMVGMFILGLGLGSLVLGRWAVRAARPGASLGTLAFLVGLSCLLWTPLIGSIEPWLGEVRAWAYGGAASPADLERGHRWVALAGGGLLFLLPAFLLGPTFSLCVRWAAGHGASEPRAVGAVYLANSAGSVLGPVLAAWVLTPILGPATAVGVLALLVLGTGTLARGSARGWHDGWGPGRIALGLALCVTLAVTLGLATRGSQDRLLRDSHVLARKPDRKLLAVQSDSVTTASVVETGEGERILYTDDFAAAATGPQYRYMRLLGHLPALLAERQENALVIAFGTGTTAGAVARHPGVKRLEVAEVSRAVLDLAPWFKDVHGGVLEDPRTEVRVTDGREALLLHEADLDVITLEPLMPYSPAGLPFYTREFYELAHDRLREGGVLCQWVPVHAMRVGLYEALLRAFFEVFPDGTLWFFEQSTALIGRKGAQAPGRAEIERRFAAVQAHLAEAGYPTPALLESACIATGRTVLARPPAEPGFSDRVVRDLDPWPEFHATPRGVLTSYLGDTLHLLVRIAQAGAPPAPLGSDGAAWARLHQGALLALEARTLDARAQHLALAAPSRAADRVTLLEQSAQQYGRALERLEGEQALTWRRARTAREAAELTVRSMLAEAGREATAGRLDNARDLRRSALKRAAAAAALDDGVPAWSGRARAARTYAFALVSLGRCAAAREALEKASEVVPKGRERDEVLALLEVVTARLAGTGASEALPPWLGPVPDCGDDGRAGLAPLFAAWEQERQASQPRLRSLRQAERSLVAAAEAEGLVVETLAQVRAAPAGSGPWAQASRAVLLRRLDPQDATLRTLIAGASAAEGQEVALAAAAQAGASKLLREMPAEALRALHAAVDAKLRAAFLAAVAEDGDRTLLRFGVERLDDPDRSVRHAAVSVVLPHDAEQLADYDLDQPGTWGRVQRRLR